MCWSILSHARINPRQDGRAECQNSQQHPEDAEACFSSIRARSVRWRHEGVEIKRIEEALRTDAPRASGCSSRSEILPAQMRFGISHMEEDFPFSACGERRHEPRMPVHAQASVLVAGHRALKGKAVDISSGGVCVTLTKPMQLGASCKLHLKFQSELHERVIVVGRVCFCVGQGDHYRIGIHCSGLNEIDELRQALQPHPPED
jgi:hypothetical protein